MKKLFYLMSLCLCMFAGAAVMTACGDDDEEDNTPKEEQPSEEAKAAVDSVKALVLGDWDGIVSVEGGQTGMRLTITESSISGDIDFRGDFSFGIKAWKADKDLKVYIVLDDEEQSELYVSIVRDQLYVEKKSGASEFPVRFPYWADRPIQ